MANINFQLDQKKLFSKGKKSGAIVLRRYITAGKKPHVSKPKASKPEKTFGGA